MSGGASLPERRPFRDEFWLAMHTLLKEPEFEGLSRLAWFAFLAIASHWRRTDEAWPSQERIAWLCRCTPRAVRPAVRELHRAGVVSLRRERTGKKGERIYYSPGPTTQRGLARYVERFRRDGRSASPPENASAEQPRSAEIRVPVRRNGFPGKWLRIKKLVVNRAAVAPAAAAAADRDEQQQRGSSIREEDREAARVALEEYFRRRHPARRSPRSFDPVDVDLVAQCLAAVDEPSATKLETVRDAIAGAFHTSKRAPTIRFIWGQLAHFLAHAERGQQLRRTQHPRSSDEARGGAIPREQREADMTRLFGPAWRGK